MMWNNEKPTKTDLVCPITGSPLWERPHDMDIMDGPTFLYTESDPKIIYAKWPRGYSYDLIDSFDINAKPSRYFILKDDVWAEYISPDSLYGELLPINTSQEEINEKVKIKKTEREKRQAEYNTRIANGEIPLLMPIVRRVFAQTINLDLVEEKPLGPPVCQLMYLDYQYKKIKWYSKYIQRFKSYILKIKIKYGKITAF